MIFNQKEHPKMFWVEGLVYLAIIITCMLGSFGVFDAKAQLTELPDPQVVQKPLAVDKCETWVELPATLRIRILQFGMITELMNTDIKSGKESMINCLSQHRHMKLLDEDIVAECNKGEKEFLADVFDRGLEKIIFRCLKWVNGEENETSTD